MLRTIRVLVGQEIAKTIRSRFSYFGPIAAVLVCVLTFVASQKHAAMGNPNAWGYVALSMQLAFTDIGIIFIVVFTSLLLAEEIHSGTARVVLSAPVYRWEFYSAKVAVGLLYMLLLFAICLLASAGFAAVHYDFGGIRDVIGLVYGWREVAVNLLLACVLSCISLAALVMCGVLVSVVVGKPGPAVGIAVGAVYFIDLTKHSLGLNSFVFTRYIEYPWVVFNNVAQGVGYQWTPEVWKMLGLTSVYIVVPFLIGLFIFTRRDLN
jgi:ABC-type transport system involved in multi-copper enzyme maturation permease subunit